MQNSIQALTEQAKAINKELQNALKEKNKTRYLTALLDLANKQEDASQSENTDQKESLESVLVVAKMDFDELFPEQELPVESSGIVNASAIEAMLSGEPVVSVSMPLTSPAPQTSNDNYDWYYNLMNTISQPIPAKAPVQQASLTPEQLADQLAQLSSSDLSTVLQKVSSSLGTSKPMGDEKTSSFLTGLYSAFDGLTTLLGQVAKSTDLKAISTLNQYLKSRLLQIAGSL